MKPICVACRRFFKPEKNGFYFTEGMPEDGAKPGLAEADRWSPYKIWSGDLWACPGCGVYIIVGVGRGPVAEHYQPDFKSKHKAHGADQFQVNDC